mgnify:CR=1 FL=1
MKKRFDPLSWGKKIQSTAHKRKLWKQFYREIETSEQRYKRKSDWHKSPVNAARMAAKRRYLIKWRLFHPTKEQLERAAKRTKELIEKHVKSSRKKKKKIDRMVDLAIATRQQLEALQKGEVVA